MDGFEALSPRSRFTRFMSPVDHLTQAEVDYFFDVDHHTHEALVAVADETDDRIGIARFICEQEDPATAEVAFTVADAWQHRGVGTALLRALAETARANGVRRFTAEILAENDAMRALFGRLDGARFSPPRAASIHADAPI